MASVPILAAVGAPSFLAVDRLMAHPGYGSLLDMIGGGNARKRPGDESGLLSWNAMSY
jgi:hypothetical protein